MYVTPTCPGCGATQRFAWPALIAPFITDYVLSGVTRACNLCECNNCGLRFFDQRYSEEELARLYHDYRGERYVAIRRRHEPRYENAAAIGDIAARRAGVNAFLARYVNPNASSAVLDFGGDDGGLIPPCFVGKRLVYDVTEKPLTPGVMRINNLKSLADDPPAFVLLCHVLEHLSDPIAVLQTIAGFLPSRGKLYVEVPNERFRLRWLGPPRYYRKLFDFTAQQHIAAPLVNAMVRRLTRTSVSPVALDAGRSNRKINLVEFLRSRLPLVEDLRLHEHINFFDPRSLATVVGHAGFQVIASATDSSVHRLLCERR
jgi:hypothetical protein